MNNMPHNYMNNMPQSFLDHVRTMPRSFQSAQFNWLDTHQPLISSSNQPPYSNMTDVLKSWVFFRGSFSSYAEYTCKHTYSNIATIQNPLVRAVAAITFMVAGIILRTFALCCDLMAAVLFVPLLPLSVSLALFYGRTRLLECTFLSTLQPLFLLRDLAHDFINLSKAIRGDDIQADNNITSMRLPLSNLLMKELEYAIDD